MGSNFNKSKNQSNSPTNFSAREKSSQSVSYSTDFTDDEPIEQKVITNSNKDVEFNLEKDFNFNLKLKHSYLKATNNPIKIPMMTELFTKDCQSNSKASIDLICLIDNSGSMQGEKINLLKNSFENILEYLGDNDRLSIVQFNSSATRLTPLLRMNNKNKSSTLKKIQNITANGGTNIGRAFETALQIIKQRKYVNSVTSVLILSDGLDDRAENSIRQQIKNNKDGGVYTINTFGYGSDHDPKMMSALSGMKDGSFYFIDKLDTMDEVFVDCLGGLISVVSSKVQLKIEPSQNEDFRVEVAQAYGPSNFWLKTGNSYNAEVLQLIAGKTYNHVFDLILPVPNLNLASRTFIVATGVCTLTDFDGKQIVKEASCEITFTDEDDQANEQVVNNYLRVQIAESIKEANLLAEASKFEDAQKVLEIILEDLKSTEFKEKEFVKNLIKDVESAIQNIKPVVYNQTGKHNLIENMTANMCQKSNLKSANIYSNYVQMDMAEKIKSKKMMSKEKY
jgi:uncharacterized protein YegL